MATGMFSQVVLAVKALPTLCAHLSFFTRVDHKVQVQVLFTFEAFVTHRADEWPVRVVAQFVPLKVLLAFQASPTDITDEPPLNLVAYQMLL